MVRNLFCYSAGDDQSTRTEILLILMTNWSIYVRSENIIIWPDGIDVVYI